MSWQNDRAKKVCQLQQHCNEIQSKLDAALGSLSDLSKGYGTGNYANHATNMQQLASNSLVKIAKMKQCEKPFIWWC